MFLGAQFDRGLAWVHFAEGHGGLGLNPKLQRMVNERVYAGARPTRCTAIRSATACAARRSWRGGATSRRSATSARCSPARRSGASCSPSPAPAPTSPGCRRRASMTATSGSCNGQKVWTTLAHVSKWGLLVVRTDPKAVKHAGLTAFVVDMQAADRRDPAAASDDRRGGVQRGVLHRHPHPRRRDAREPGRRLAGVADDVDERARLDRRHDPGAGLGHDRRPGEDVERAARRAQGRCGPATR